MRTINKYLVKQASLGLAVLVVVFAVGYFLIYRPFVSHLQEQTYENYRLLATQKEMGAEQYIARSMEGAESLSSRSMIRDAIGDYLDGEISFDALVGYTQPRYADGVDALENVDASRRVVDGDVIAQVPVDAEAVMTEDVDGITATEYRVITQDDQTVLIVISPIILDGDVIGHDIVRYMMCDFLDALQGNESTCAIIGRDDRDALLNDVEMLIEADDYHVFKKSQDVVYLSDGLSGSDSVFIKVTAGIDAVEADLNRLTTRTLFWDGVFFVVSFALFFYLIARDTSARIKLSDFKKDMYREKANKDALTDVYSRHYLRDWIEQFKEDENTSNTSLLVVMTDINGFKQYNDKHGHDAGDKTLIRVGEIMRHHTDEDGIVVRYGGDEFLLVSKDVCRRRWENLMETINQVLKREMGLSLAYGIAMAKTPDTFEETIRHADERMYEDKGDRHPE